jgi:hypothetical protein
MKPSLNLTPNERATLDQIIDPLSKSSKYPLSLNLLIKKWQDFVAKVQKGYSFSIYDYTNDLSVRDLLQQISEQVPKPLMKKIVDIINPIDDKYIKTTRKVDRPLSSFESISEDQFWWFRIPKVLKEELKKDLISLHGLKDI